MTHFLILLWVLPASLPGLLLALPVCLSGGKARLLDGVLEVCGGRLLHQRSAPWLLRFEAITLGHVVIARSAASMAALRAHERVHVRQYERWGVLFYPLYLASSLWQWAAGRDPYFDNRFEREAFALAPECLGPRR